MNCKKCGNELKEGENFCSKCGKSINYNPVKKHIIIIAIVVIVIISIALIGGIIFIPKIISNIKEQRFQKEMQADLDNINIQLKQQEIVLPYQGSYNEGLYENTYNINLENVTDYKKYENFVEKYAGGTLEITGNININAIGEYEINYTVTSDKGNQKSEKMLVKIKDFMRPELNISNDVITVEKGNDINVLEGIVAEDNVDNKEELTSKIKTEGTVDVNKIGEYIIKYKVTDNAGWSTERTRTYKIIEKKNIKIGVEYMYRIYNQYYTGGYADSSIMFYSGNKVNYVAVEGMDFCSYSGYYTLQDDIITANVEYHDNYLGDGAQTLKIKIIDSNTIEFINTGAIFRAR